MYFRTTLSNLPSSLFEFISALPRRRCLIGVSLALMSLAAFSTALAVAPAPDGGYDNGTTAEGADALNSLTSGVDNTAIGFIALFNNTTGSENRAVGSNALFHGTSGNNNTAISSDGLTINTTGNNNTASGADALSSNTAGFYNTAEAFQALANLLGSSSNIAIGYNAGINLFRSGNNVDIGNERPGQNPHWHQGNAHGHLYRRHCWRDSHWQPGRR